MAFAGITNSDCSSLRNVIQLPACTANQKGSGVMVKPVHMMVITPHPDDAEFGVAGTVARWTGEGKDVIYVVCTNGDKGSNDPDVKPRELARIREKEQLAAAKLLRVREVIFLRHPDGAISGTVIIELPDRLRSMPSSRTPGIFIPILIYWMKGFRLTK